MILHDLLSYEVLRVTWWLLMGVLLIGFAVTDGFDLGVAALLPVVGKTDLERRTAINSIGPFWEGNQAWLILAGGASFAAWPHLYAVAFSGFYLAMFAILVALILRPVAFKFRGKRDSGAWRRGWDRVLAIGGLVAALILGVAMGNVLLGAPFRFDPDMRIHYEGGLFGLLSPFALLAGLISVAMVTMHGAAWLVLKTDGAVSRRAGRAGALAAIATAALYALAGWCLATLVDGYEITGTMAHDGPSNPLLKSAAPAVGAWMTNYRTWPVLWLAPALGLAMPLVAALLLRLDRGLAALLASGLGIAGIILSVGAAMFPFILPSTIDARYSLMVWDSSSSHLTLFIMLVVTLFFLPIVLAYTTWVFRVLRGKVDSKAIAEDRGHAY